MDWWLSNITIIVIDQAKNKVCILIKQYLTE